MDNAAHTSANVELIGHNRAPSPSGYWEWDLNTGGVTWSDGMFRAFDLEPGSVAASYDLFVSIVHPEDRESCVTGGSNAVNQGQNIDSEFRIILPCGGVRWVANKGEVFRDAAGKPSWAAGVLIIGFDTDPAPKILNAGSKLAFRYSLPVA